MTLGSKIRELSRNITIYGLGDVAVSIVGFFLLPVFVNYLDATDYGVLAILGAIEVIGKIVFRFGLDGSFMRFFYECETDRDRQRLASTVFVFLLVFNGAILVPLLMFAPALGHLLFGSAAYTTTLRLLLVNTFMIGFTFLPFHVLRIERQSAVFSALTLGRSVLTIVFRVLFVMGLRLRLTGLYLADVLVTTIVMVALVRWFLPLLRPMFSRAVLRESLRFGLPRVPHAGAQQVMAVGDRFVLNLFATVTDIGVYQIAVTFGLTQKLFLSAFESAWAPFYYATVREPGAPQVFKTVTTYGFAVLVLLTAGLSATGRELVAALTHGRILAPDDPRWAAVGTVVTWTAIGVLLQGVYLLTSIGLNITKRTAVLSGRDDARCGDEHRAELSAHSALRHRWSGVGQRRGLRGAGGPRLRVLPAVLPDRLRVGTPRPSCRSRHRRVRRRAGAPGRAPGHVQPAIHDGEPPGCDGAGPDGDGGVRAAARRVGVLPRGGTPRAAAALAAAAETTRHRRARQH